MVEILHHSAKQVVCRLVVISRLDKASPSCEITRIVRGRSRYTPFRSRSGIIATPALVAGLLFVGLRDATELYGHYPHLSTMHTQPTRLTRER
jgi:hypothetical protein